MTTIPTGIHRFQSRPITVEAAEWVPDDPYQRGALLGWLTGNGINWRVRNPTESGEQAADWIHLVDATGETFDAVGPSDVVVYDREMGEIISLTPGDFHDRFENPVTIGDPHQPSLLDLLGAVSTLVIKHI